MVEDCHDRMIVMINPARTVEHARSFAEEDPRTLPLLWLAPAATNPP